MMSTVWRSWLGSSQSGGTSTAVSTRSALAPNGRCSAAMRLPAATTADLNDSLVRLTREPPLPQAITAHAQAHIPVSLGRPRPGWVTLLREDGSLERFPTSAESPFTLPPQPIGRHRLLNEDRPEQACHLIVAPSACYLPPELEAGARRFGIAAHLYSLRSHGDQGIGDFTTLARFAAEAVRAGADVIGLNPLHALFPHDRSRASPYQPSDRHFLDPIYIDVSGFPGGGVPPSPAGAVDYNNVWEHKRAVLQAAFDPADRTPIPDSLRRFAIFETITETLGTSQLDRLASRSPPPREPRRGGLRRPNMATPSASTPGCRVLADQQLATAAKSGLRWASTATSPSAPRRTGRRPGPPRTTSCRAFRWARHRTRSLQQGQIWSLPPPDPVAMRGNGFAASQRPAGRQHAPRRRPADRPRHGPAPTVRDPGRRPGGQWRLYHLSDAGPASPRSPCRASAPAASSSAKTSAPCRRE